MSLIFGSAPIHCFFLGLFSFDSGRRVKVTDFIVGQENILSCIQSLAWRLLHSNRILLGFSHIACSSLHNWYWETRVYSTAAKKSVTKVPGFNNQLITFKRYIRVATREDSRVLCFPSRRGLTPRGILECNPEIPAFPGEER